MMIRIVDALDDVALLANARVGKNRVGRGQVLQVTLERADVDRSAVRDVCAETERGRGLLGVVESGELTDAHAHGIPRMDQPIGNRLDAPETSVGISRRPVS